MLCNVQWYIRRKNKQCLHSFCRAKLIAARLFVSLVVGTPDQCSLPQDELVYLTGWLHCGPHRLFPLQVGLRNHLLQTLRDPGHNTFSAGGDRKLAPAWPLTTSYRFTQPSTEGATSSQRDGKTFSVHSLFTPKLSFGKVTRLIILKKQRSWEEQADWC